MDNDALLVTLGAIVDTLEARLAAGVYSSLDDDLWEQVADYAERLADMAMRYAVGTLAAQDNGPALVAFARSLVEAASRETRA